MSQHDELQLQTQHNEQFLETMRQQIIAFNAAHFAGLVRVPLGFARYNEQGELLAGIAGKTFGHWFLLEYLWVAQDARGQGLGRQLLIKAEQEAAQRGCHFVLLDTLDFQAQPFYQALGYQTQWVQADYPRTGSKFFMTKQLLAQGHAEIA